MGRLRLSKLPLLVILCLYIGRLVATVHHHDDSIEEEGMCFLPPSLSQYSIYCICIIHLFSGLLHSKCSQLNSKRSCLFDDDEVRLCVHVHVMYTSQY